MILLYRGSGSNEVQLLGASMPEHEWLRLRQSACRLLRAGGHNRAAALLESEPFALYEGTNSFNDEFSLLYLSVPAERYVAYGEQRSDGACGVLYRQIARALGEVGAFIRFVAVGLDKDSGPEPVAQPTLATTSEAVERALCDAEKLIQASGAPSSVDRVHTALHGYLRMVASGLAIPLDPEADITRLFKLIRQEHPALQPCGPRTDDIDRVLKTMASIVDALNPLRNHASIAHPNDTMLEEAEAMLVVNAVRTLLHYLNKKIGAERAGRKGVRMNYRGEHRLSR